MDETLSTLAQELSVWIVQATSLPQVYFRNSCFAWSQDFVLMRTFYTVARRHMAHHSFSDAFQAGFSKALLCQSRSDCNRICVGTPAFSSHLVIKGEDYVVRDHTDQAKDRRPQGLYLATWLRTSTNWKWCVPLPWHEARTCFPGREDYQTTQAELHTAMPGIGIAPVSIPTVRSTSWGFPNWRRGCPQSISTSASLKHHGICAHTHVGCVYAICDDEHCQISFTTCKAIEQFLDRAMPDVWHFCKSFPIFQ